MHLLFSATLTSHLYRVHNFKMVREDAYHNIFIQDQTKANQDANQEDNATTYEELSERKW